MTVEEKDEKLPRILGRHHSSNITIIIDRRREELFLGKSLQVNQCEGDRATKSTISNIILTCKIR